MSTQGYQAGKKWRPLERMFNEVPGRYDLVNRLITLGQDERWRKRAAEECMAGNPSCVLDLCTGTGDLALWMAKNAKESIRIYALDYSEPMLDLARNKAGRRKIDRIKFLQGDAAHLPYEPGSLDSVGIAFAFRNLTYKNPDRDRFLAEIFRVIKENGKFVIVESSQPSNRTLKGFFRIYLRVFVAGLGGLVSGQRGAYRYLAASAKNFSDPQEIKDLLLDTGFKKVEHKALLGGAAGLTIAVK